MGPLVRKSLLLLLVIFIVAAQPVFACSWKCVHEIDGDKCRDYGRPVFNGAESCTVATQCTLVVYDPDGPGPGTPTVLIQCRYLCDMKYCLWV